MSQRDNRQITVAEMAPHVHSFQYGENKVNKISSWLIRWIQKSLEEGKIKPNDFLPSKGDLACHIGVSLGTMQSVFRYLEDIGLVESKQKIGTYIKEQGSNIIKLTSKRELACAKLKEYISKSACCIGDKIPSIRELAKIIKSSNTTVRIAINTLISEKILKKSGSLFVINDNNFSIKRVEAKTLMEKVAKQIKQDIISNLSEGDKLPSNPLLAKRYNVSIKTIHDALKYLSNLGIVHTRRGQYGTIVIKENTNINMYQYEAIGYKLKKYISQNLKVGDKLPSIKELAEQFNVSPKTISKAFDDLKEDGFIMSSRGRNGGTFVTDIPQSSSEAYTWLALNPEYVSDN